MLKGASATLLLTLAARAAASRVAPELAFRDEAAGHIARRSPYALDGYAQDPGFVRGVVLRSCLMDAMARDFFARHPHGMAVSLGAGLCTRRERLIEDGTLDAGRPWLLVDLPDVIALRRSLMPGALHGAAARDESAGHGLACSLLDEARWLGEVPSHAPVLFLLEGVCPYLPEGELRDWFTRMGGHRQAARGPWEMVLDFVDPALLALPTQVGDMDLPLRSAFTGVDELVSLHPAWRALGAHHPFSRFSPGHAQFEASMRARTGRPLYTVAHLELALADGPH